MSNKKLLIREVFEKGKRESGRDSKNGIALFLILYFEENLKFNIVEKTLVRYYDALIRDDKDDYNIDNQTLDKLSQYLKFKNFSDFCKTESFTKKNSDSSFTSVKVSIDDEGDYGKVNPNITINVTTNPILKLQEFLTKHSNMGIVGVVLLGSLIAGSKVYKADEKVPDKTIVQDSVFQNNIPFVENSAAQTVVYVPQLIANIPGNKEKRSEIFLKQCMYWNGKEYIPEDCNDTKNGLVAIDMKLVANFKKITRPDTISSIKNVWYSKCKNVVEFFTDNGINPENGRDLRPLTPYMLEKYAK
ncbi:hypothetical protein [Epilithonimonas sp. UC225_85]|uniref:hypothetical protein n=1 Tax=Epilithonimonas sp. UC225_85 TaxID=3350167 RepID=UPI0036D30D39